MVKFSSDFECGNGKNFQQISSDRFRCQVKGDKKVYCYYFCFDVISSEKKDITIEVWHDPDINDPDGFISHFPTTIWISKDGRRFLPLDKSYCKCFDDHIEISLFLMPEQKIRVTNNWVCSYSDTCDFINKIVKERKNCEFFVPGKSFGNRDIMGIRTGNTNKPVVMCIAGQHPVEFPGIWAVRAVIDFITSSLPEAKELRNDFLFEIIPIVNPDGNVAGRNCFTDEGIDLYQVFGENPFAAQPPSKEGELLWNLATSQPLCLWINFHCYLGWRANSEYPYDGWYQVPYDVFSDTRQKTIYQALCDTLRLQTDAPSTWIEPEIHWKNSFEYQLALRYNIPHVFYEINGGTAGPFQSGKRGLKVFTMAMKTLKHFYG